MESITEKTKERMDKSILSLNSEFAVIRTGRASSAMFDKIKVEYYGQQSPLSQVATISIPEARLVVIQPWDKALLGEIEKAIQKSELSLNPNNDGKIIRISIPPLTEERRKEYVKLAKSIAEKSRVAIRNIRRDANDSFKKQEKSHELSEDDVKRGMEKIQKLTDQFIENINSILEKKEKEIMEV